MKSLASDNYSTVSPEILEYLSEVNKDHAKAYGNDEITQHARKCVLEALGLPDAAVHFVLTGTAANVLSVKQSLRSIDSVLVARTSHLNTNETASPEVVAGNKLIPIPVEYGKMLLQQAEAIILQEYDNMPHAPRPRMLSIAQSTEYGTVYTLEELKQISDFCKKYRLLLHLDLCRVYNAACHLQVSLKDMISAANPDIMSLGGTKNGLMFAEAVVIVNKNLQEDFVMLQKQSMQLYSKMRYLSAQFIPFFEKEIWKRNAESANAMCTYLYEKMKDIQGVEITTPVNTNHLFIKLPKYAIQPLQEVSPFYIWDVATNEVRLVTSFDTTKEEIDIFYEKLLSLLTT